MDRAVLWKQLESIIEPFYESIDSLQQDLDIWIDYYNNERTHQGKMCCGRTPMDTLLDGKSVWQEKKLN